MAQPGKRAAQAVPLALLLAESSWLAIVLVGPAAINQLAANPFHSTKLIALAPLAALLGAAWLAALGRGALPAVPARLPLAAIAGFFAVIVLSTVTSQTPSVAFFGDYLRREGLAAWSIAGLLFASMVTLVRRREQLERIVDALLLGSVVPCIFAVLQEAGWAAGHALDLPWLRTGATLGNPVFLGDYLLLLIPLTLARLVEAGMPEARPAQPVISRARAAWLALLILQSLAMFLSQSRGPLLSLVVALCVFAVLLAGIRRSRRLLLLLGAVLLTGCAVLAALNLVPQLGAAARTVPGLSRFVFAGTADLSSISRIDTWQAGIDTLRDAPVLRQLIGYGPDTAYFHYFAHIPAAVLQVEGQMTTVDRMHNECLELAGAAGIAGLACYIGFLAALLRLAAQALGFLRNAEGRGRAGSWLWFGVLPLTAGVAAAVALATLSGRAGFAPAGFGVGLGIAWAIALARDALRAWPKSAGGPLPDGQVMIAALAAAVLGFWVDSQVSLPVLATRSVFFTIAALLVLLASRSFDDPATGAPAQPQGRIAGWSVAVVLIVVIVGFLPAPFAHVVVDPMLGAGSWTAIAILLAAPVAFEWLRLVGSGGPPPWATSVLSASRGFAWELALCTLPFILVYLALAGLQVLILAERTDLALAAPVMWAWLWLPCCGLILAVQRGRSGSAQGARATPARPVRWLPWLACVLVAGVAIGGWAELRADLLSQRAAVAQAAGREDVFASLLERMTQILPGERHYAVAEATHRLERTVAALSTGNPDAARLHALAGQMRLAEAELRAALAQAPEDPWVVFALGNVLQFEGLKALRPLIGAEAEGKALEARRLFRQAHLMYPAQPLFLRNWAQLEFDAGELAEAYGLLDQMEALVPASEEPYAERLHIASQAGDQSTVAATLARAALRLGPVEMAHLRSSVNPREH